MDFATLAYTVVSMQPCLLNEEKKTASSSHHRIPLPLNFELFSKSEKLFYEILQYVYERGRATVVTVPCVIMMSFVTVQFLQFCCTIPFIFNGTILGVSYLFIYFFTCFLIEVY